MSLKKDIENVYSIAQSYKNYNGPIFTFDLDKTYLATDFDQITQLIKIRFQKAQDKENIPGAATLACELKKLDAPIFFISASPKSMESVIREKFRIDRLDIDGLLLRNYIDVIRNFQFKNILDKIGYKLAALLYGRTVFPVNSHEILFGDDSEYDSVIYSIYADIIAKRLEVFEVITILKAWGVNNDEIELIEYYINLLEDKYPKHKFKVEQIFIHLETTKEIKSIHNLSPLVIPTYNYFQIAIILYIKEYITRDALGLIISNLLNTYVFRLPDFTNATNDLVERNLLEKKAAEKLIWWFSNNNQIKKLDPFVMGQNKPLLPPNLIKSNLFSFFKKKKSNTLFSEAYENNILNHYLSYKPKRNIKK